MKEVGAVGGRPQPWVLLRLSLGWSKGRRMALRAFSLLVLFEKGAMNPLIRGFWSEASMEPTSEFGARAACRRVGTSHPAGLEGRCSVNGNPVLRARSS